MNIVDRYISSYTVMTMFTLLSIFECFLRPSPQFAIYLNLSSINVGTRTHRKHFIKRK
jgi:hypothetical protein